MPHPLVEQLRFSRSELARCLEGVSPEDAVRRIQPMNCLSWIVGHLAAQEQYFWIIIPQAKIVHPDLFQVCGYGQPGGTPPLDDMRAAWREVTACADEYLDRLTADLLQTRLIWEGQPMQETVGTMLQRNIYHYWYHTGEAAGIRQALGHTGLAEFVGNLGGQAPYRPE